MPHDLIKKKLIASRTSQSTYTSIPVEFPIGIGQAVSLIAIHWMLEQAKTTGGAGLFMAALSENPEHELNPPVGVWEFMSDPAIYGMGAFWQYIIAAGTDNGSGVNFATLVIPLYRMLRPKRQVAVFANIWAPLLTGIRGEIYYEEEVPSREVVDAISRRYGKYRRT